MIAVTVHSTVSVQVYVYALPLSGVKVAENTWVPISVLVGVKEIYWLVPPELEPLEVKDAQDRVSTSVFVESTTEAALKIPWAAQPLPTTQQLSNAATVDLWEVSIVGSGTVTVFV